MTDDPVLWSFCLCCLNQCNITYLVTEHPQISVKVLAAEG